MVLSPLVWFYSKLNSPHAACNSDADRHAAGRLFFIAGWHSGVFYNSDSPDKNLIALILTGEKEFLLSGGNSIAKGTAMRRTDKEITDIAVIEDIIAEATVCRLALCDGGKPYIVPMIFGYRDRVVFLHCAKDGRKIEALRRNGAVCVEFETQVSVAQGPKACNWKMRYKSVIGFGGAAIVDGAAEKRAALDVIMAHYSTAPFEYGEESLAKIVVVKVPLATVTCKVSGYEPCAVF
jgi:uncharacterized protein